MRPPATDRDDVVETLHGHRVADPYRWLEDPDSARTRGWVADQRDYFDQVFAGIGHRDWFTTTMNTILRQPHAGLPSRQHGRYLRRVRTADQDQDVLVGATSLDDPLDTPAKPLPGATPQTGPGPSFPPPPAWTTCSTPRPNCWTQTPGPAMPPPRWVPPGSAPTDACWPTASAKPARTGPASPCST
ncbi:hypothetical protein ACPCG0_05935 [Propionibacteriaceae bacterium Y1923]